LEADSFHRSAIAQRFNPLGINLATSCNDPGALVLVIEAALREMSPRREKANSLMKKVLSTVAIRALWRSSRMSLADKYPFSQRVLSLLPREARIGIYKGKRLLEPVATAR
jgi:hypothetical protein